MGRVTGLLHRVSAHAALLAMRPRRYLQFRRLQREEALRPDALRSRQEAKLRELLRHCVRNVPFYRKYRKLVQEGQWQPLEVVKCLPLVDKHLLASEREEFLAEGYKERRILSTTGGSSGTWFEFFVDAGTKYRRMAHDIAWRQWTGWRVGEPYGFVWGHPGDLKESRGWGRRLRYIAWDRAVVLNAYDMSEKDIERFVDEARRKKVTMLLGYASGLGLVADWMQGRGEKLPEALRGVVTAAETLTRELRGGIEQGFGVSAFNRYGSREFGVIAQECEVHRGLHVAENHVVVEILDKEGKEVAPGEWGEVVITNLDNFVMPFVRYRTGDTARWSTDTGCPCGRPYRKLAEVGGRLTDLLVGRNGRVYSCQSPRLFMTGLRGVRQMQIVQRRLDDVVARVVPGPGWSKKEELTLRRRLVDLLGEGTSVSIQYEKEIPPAPSGKYRFVISSVPSLKYLVEGKPPDLLEGE